MSKEERRGDKTSGDQRRSEEVRQWKKRVRRGEELRQNEMSRGDWTKGEKNMCDKVRLEETRRDKKEGMRDETEAKGR